MVIWIVGGTKESKEIVSALSNVISDYIITVATPEAKQLYDPHSEIVVGKMNRELMKQFCLDRQITKIIDASHPFAVEVSQNVIVISQELNIPYLRYERAKIEGKTTNNCRKLANFTTLLQGDYLLNQRVFLTVGCKSLSLFQSWQDRAVLYTRVLPKLESLQMAIAAGFTSDRIIAIRPPITAELELALWQQWRISLVVTKASGKSGGEDIKQQVASKLGIKLITIARPSVTYPRQTNVISKVIKFCQ